MVAVEGQFTFTAERPQLSCAAFLVAEPSEVISVEYDRVDVDCGAGDFVTVTKPLPLQTCISCFTETYLLRHIVVKM